MGGLGAGGPGVAGRLFQGSVITVRGLAVLGRATLFAPTSMLTAAVLLGVAPLMGWAAGNEQWLIFILLTGVGLTPIFIRWPVVSTLGIYALLLPFDMVAGLAGGATLTRFIGLAAGGVLVVTGLMQRRLIRPPLSALWFGVLIFWGVCSVAWAIDPDLVVSRLRTALSLFVLYLVCVSFRVSRKELSAVCTLAVLGAMASASAAYVLGIAAGDAQGRMTLTVGDVAANANKFAASLVFPMALAIGGLLRARQLPARVAAVIAIAVIGGGIYISISRGALLALGVVVAALVYRTGLRWQVSMVALVLVLLLGAMPEAFFTRVTAPVTGVDATGAGRTVIWGVGLSALDDFWLFGSGLSTFGAVYGQLTHGAEYRGAHNIFLGTWVELGIVGLALLLAAITGHILAAWRVRFRGLRDATLSATEAGCLGLLVCSFFGDYLWLKGFWMAWILLAWSTRLAREEGAEAPAGQVLPVERNAATLSLR